MNILVFEDAEVAHLFPVTAGRPAFAISCGSLRLIDWLSQFHGHLIGVVRPHLQQLLEEDFPALSNKLNPEVEWTLAVNARCVPSAKNFRLLQQLANEKEAAVVRSDWSILAALLPTRQMQDNSPSELLESLERFSGEAGKAHAVLALDLDVLEYPHDIIRFHLQCMKDNLVDRGERGAYSQIADGVLAADKQFRLNPQVSVDASHGPIVIEAGAQIGPHTFLRGPVHIGRDARIIEHASIKDSVSIGQCCKVGGEVEGTNIEPYSNKQHYGFLGHSYVGSWVNLGAGTCNSDLKNTYGEVKMTYRGQTMSTGMQFLGCIIGDYAKTAINTSIFTGKLIGVCSMLYGYVTTNVPSFVNYARLFGQVTELPPSVIVTTQQRMFARRNLTQRECDTKLLYDMYELTRHERQLAEEPLVL